MTIRSSPTFSVVMPAYNSAHTVSVAIESVLSQTRGDFELIVVDNGSSDDTVDRVAPYLGDDRLTLISEREPGPAQARNAGLAVARGVYVSLLDSDDVWLPRYLEVMGSALDDDPVAAVAYTDAWVLDDGLRKIARRTAMSPYHPPRTPKDAESFLRALLVLGNFVFVGATIRRSTLTAIGPFRLGVDSAEDYELWLRFAAGGHRFVRCREPLAIYRRSAGQLTSQVDRLRRAVDEVLRIVEDEYEVSEDIRRLARQRLPLRLVVRGRPRPVPQVLRRPYGAFARTRRFYIRAPKDVRAIFPDLRAL
jgi:glycosyltransferase involved in cell wall biosynthesis